MTEPFFREKFTFRQKWLKKTENNQKLYFLRLSLKTAPRIFLIFGLMLVEMILYHSAQTAGTGKFRFLSYGVKSSRPIRLLDYFFKL